MLLNGIYVQKLQPLRIVSSSKMPADDETKTENKKNKLNSHRVTAIKSNHVQRQAH